MNFEELKELIEKIDASSLKVFELENEEVSVKMSKNDTTEFVQSQQEVSNSQPININEESSVSSPISNVKEEVTSQPVEEQTAELPEDLHEVTAPIVGTAYLSPSPDKDPFVKVGDEIKEGQPLIIVEAMKVMNEIKSDVSGEVVNILVEDGQPIEFGQALVQIKK